MNLASARMTSMTSDKFVSKAARPGFALALVAVEALPHDDTKQPRLSLSLDPNTASRGREVASGYSGSKRPS